MKNIHLLWFAFLINLRESKMLCSALDSVPVAPVTTTKQSIYCPHINCWSLKNCFLHNARYIFLESVLNKKIRKKTKPHEQVHAILPMFPPELRYLVGSYAQEVPTQYKITHCIQNEKLTVVNPSCYQGTLTCNPETSCITLTRTSDLLYSVEKTISIVVTRQELDFFRLSDRCDVRYEYRPDKSVYLEIGSLAIGHAKTHDLIHVKLISTEATMALKKAALLPKKKKQ